MLFLLILQEMAFDLMELILFDLACLMAMRL
ncbi:hypothetical protein DFP76_103243 [Marinomonas aquiplantarum]|uniref:Uncharacterized protein n=1 Tax=Marinomonas aquiplantarum TaxID=491951 RepID=A0A366D381_9GAMM|nr:hypothetical protein DFP76_103243 [Marinomonas aquiplantarum]